MNVKIIKSKESYAEAMARLSALMSVDPEAGSEDENELGLQALVIGDFERQSRLRPLCRNFMGRSKYEFFSHVLPE